MLLQVALSGKYAGLQLSNHNKYDTPEFPKILSEEEVERQIPGSESLHGKRAAPISDEQLTAEAVATLKMLFPRIHDRLGATWGTRQCEQYMDMLILDERGDRDGFQPQVLSALLVLQRVHAKQFGVFKRADPWDVGFKK